MDFSEITPRNVFSFIILCMLVRQLMGWVKRKRVESGKLKNCPYCTEVINGKADYCHHCHHYLKTEGRVGTHYYNQRSVRVKGRSRESLKIKDVVYGSIYPVVGALVIAALTALIRLLFF
jgi:hypothetical protein